MNPLNTLVKALLTGFGWRLGSEVAVAISDRMTKRSTPPPSATGDEDDDEDDPTDVRGPQ